MLKENFVETLESSIKYNWQLPAFTDYKGDHLTYAEVAVKIARIHLVFEKCGVQQGDKISLVGKNSSNWGIIYLATITYGAVIVPILPDFKPAEIHNIVNHSDSVVLFSGDQIVKTLDIEAIPDVRAVFTINGPDLISERNVPELKVTLEKLDELFSSKYPDGYNPDAVQYPSISNDTLAVISYTSGTTGFSKGVMLNHNSLMANVRFAQNNMPLEAGDNIVSFLPLAHAYGCAFEFLFPFSLGCHITFLTKSPSPAVVMEAFEEVKPRLILSVPLVIEKIYKKQLMPVITKFPMNLLLKTPLINQLIFKKIRKKLFGVFGGNFHEIVIGGAPFNQEAERFFRKIRFPYTVGYGMTECGPLISYASWDTVKFRSAGRPVDTLEIKIDSANPSKEVGEILVRGENVMLGYYKNVEATRPVLDEEGWLHTGDLGLIDKGQNIYIRGRNKSMILGPSGQNIYPEEIEARINNFLYVSESLVVEKNHKLIALIFPDSESIEKDGITEDQLNEIFEEHRKHLNEHAPAFMNVIEFRRYDQEFEKTPKRSIKRFLYTE